MGNHTPGQTLRAPQQDLQHSPYRIAGGSEDQEVAQDIATAPSMALLLASVSLFIEVSSEYDTLLPWFRIHKPHSCRAQEIPDGAG